MTHIFVSTILNHTLRSSLSMVMCLTIFAFFSLNTPLVASAADLPVLGSQGNIAKVKRFPDELSELPVSVNTLNRISARSAIVIDAQNDRVLFAKDPDNPRQPASTIKVLTGTIALKSMTGDESIPVSREAASRPSSKMYLDPNKEYRADELITAVLLASSNDASVALAEMLAGSEEEFARIMTLQAEHWGATNTDIKTATGLTAKGQTSTARDLALIFREAMQYPEFVARIKMRSMKTDEGNTLYNHNKALWQIDGTEGGKTGYTNAARQTYVGQFTRDGNTIIVAVMGSETMWNDVKFLVQYGFGQYRYISPHEAELHSGDETLPQADH
ncbi:D-alanyl-D-alanine carboxypeptidase family protein [Desulfosediminicola ganghwensis]|uniref:D-alanyl-D-alanine carboxypeptidase family protein n=1 Tax=Desulfosediminicola ganghwensis TaxID=2569540 RepID=UPI0010AD176E|nr:D-alanyl-D-alanine carboxypeptidase family protein [Desulfosediminicola ganghwensis]